MSNKDHAAETVEQDCLCVKCREARFKSTEEDAVASFCEDMHGPVADWFADIITQCGFVYESRYPVDNNERCEGLVYKHAKPIAITFLRGNSATNVNNSVTLGCQTIYYPAPEWFACFNCPTPAPVILAAIKTATANL
jgi:hypothetical protein